MKKKRKLQTREIINSPAAENNFVFPFTIKTEWVVFAGIACFFIVSLFIVNDYGMVIDSQKNFREGAANLNYLLSGQVDRYALQWQMHGSFVFIISDILKRLLTDTLHLYDSVAARHLALPLLTCGFAVCLFLFVRRRWSPALGAVAVGLLLTFPSFWGHTYNNLKDIPLLIFFSLSIMSFAEFYSTGRIKYLYGFFVFWGITIAIKLNGLFVPILLILWIILNPVDKAFSEKFPSAGKLMIHVLIGLVLSAVIAAALYAPAFWGIEDKLSFLVFWRDRVKEITWGRNNPFNLNSFRQMFFRTPVLVLIFATAGTVTALRNTSRSPLNPLLLLWCYIPLLIPCFPHTLIYHNGMRHFLVFLVPFCLLAMIGIEHSSRLVANIVRVSEKSVTAALAVITIVISIYGVAATHPYQTTFFNAFAGGLKGAQKKNISDAWDYWLNSYKEAGRWIDDNGAANANVLAVYYSGTPSEFNTDLVKNPITRADIKTFRLSQIPVKENKIAIPENTYVILVPFDYVRSGRILLHRSGEFRQVYRISRQGGEICSIYYKPPAIPKY